MNLSEHFTRLQYLGDGVYIGINEATDIIMFTFDGVDITNKIFLSDIDIIELMKWLQHIGHVH